MISFDAVKIEDRRFSKIDFFRFDYISAKIHRLKTKTLALQSCKKTPSKHIYKKITSYTNFVRKSTCLTDTFMSVTI